MVPNYNHAKFLPETLQAVLDQPWKPVEVVVLDDASSDESVLVVEEIARREPLVRLLRHRTNRGVVHSLNRLLDEAIGDYVYFPGADDRVGADFLCESMKLLAAHPQAGLCSSLTLTMTPAGTIQGVHKTPLVSRRPGYLSPSEVRMRLRRHGNWFQGNTVIHRRQALLDIGGFQPNLHSYADTLCAIQSALQHGACFIPKPLALWRRMPGSYAVRCAQDVQLLLEMLEAAKEMMSTRNHHPFPADYVVHWERQLRYSWSVAVLASSEGADESRAELLSLEPSGRSLLRPLMQLGVLRHPQIAKLVLIGRYFPWRAILQRVRLIGQYAFTPLRHSGRRLGVRRRSSQGHGS